MSVEEKSSSTGSTAPTPLGDVGHPPACSSSQEEKRLVRKIDMRIMPIICLMYLFAYLDRINLGNARLQGLPQDVLNGDPTGILYDWVNSAFYFSYILCPVPAIILSKLCPPRRWFGCAAIGWGVCSVLMATTSNFPGLLTTRIVLGFFEAALTPGVPFYMSLFYTREEIGVRLATYTGFAAVAGAFGGVLAFSIQNADTGIANWKLLFVVEGLPSITLGVITLLLLPNRPESTSLFNEEERSLALKRASRGGKADIGRVIQKEHIAMAFKDWRVYAAGVMYFASNCAFAFISAFLPTIITTFGFTNARAQLLTIPPYAVAAVVLCLSSYMADRIQSRGVFTVAGSVVAGLGYVLLLAIPSPNSVRYFATFLITSGTYTMNGSIIAWFAHNLGSETKKATGTPLYMVLGQCGAVVGSHLYPLTDGPRYITGLSVNCALDFLATAVAVLLTVSYRLENRHRDEIYGKVDPNAPVDTSKLADKAPQFRYTP
ncbi:MFS general substrate transporter [Daedaleopsis nitida]|nr:MFS general substrate transporter [Daedaleopsis nitida]